MTCFDQELERSVSRIFDCFSCAERRPKEFHHSCRKFCLRKQFKLNRDTSLLNFNVNEFIQNLFQKCSCRYPPSFFVRLNFDFFDDRLDTVFTLNKEFFFKEICLRKKIFSEKKLKKTVLTFHVLEIIFNLNSFVNLLEPEMNCE